VVVQTKIQERTKKDKFTKEETKAKADKEQRKMEAQVLQLKKSAIERILITLSSTSTQPLQNSLLKKQIPAQSKITEIFLQAHIFNAKSKHSNLKEVAPIDHLNFLQWTKDEEVNKNLDIIQKGYMRQLNELENTYRKNKLRIEVGDFLPLGTFRKAKIVIAKKT